MSRLQLSARPLLYTSVILTGSRSAPNACLPCLNVRLFAKTTVARHDEQTPTANHAYPQQLSKGDATNKIENDEIEYPWWFPSGAKRPAHLVRLLDEFDARVQETKTMAQTLYGEHPSDKARRLRTENAPFAPKIYTVHGDDVQSFLGYNRDFFLRSSMKEVDGKLQEIFTMKVRKWSSIPRSNRRNERRGFKLTWSDFRILVVTGLKVSKFATRRNRVRRVIHYGLKKHLPEHGKPGHDYFVLPKDSAVQISRQELEDRVLECMKAVHSLMDRKNGKSEVLRRPSAPTGTDAHQISRMSGENRPKIPISRTSNKETENRIRKLGHRPTPSLLDLVRRVSQTRLDCKGHRYGPPVPEDLLGKTMLRKRDSNQNSKK